jgi:hypothetical protein
MQEFFWIILGVVLAGGFVLAARRAGRFEREKLAYGTGLAAAALIYAGFGLFSRSTGWILTELGGVAIYTVFAVLGIRRSGWFLAIGWALHMVWDLVLHDASTEFVPRWYQLLCLGFDLWLAGYIGLREWKLKSGLPV